MKLNKFSKYVLFIIASFACIYSYAQQKTIKGLVVVDFNNDNPAGVLVTNRTTKVYSTTDIAGTFHAKVSVGDTLLFQAPSLVERKFVVRPSSFDLDPLVIHMNYHVITLKEVVANPPLTGDMRKDMQSVRLRDDIEKIYANLGIDIRTLDIKPKERKENIIPMLGPIPIPTSLNVEALYKTLTGYYRKMDNLNQFLHLDKRLYEVQNYLGDKYFVEVLEIPVGDIRGFLLYTYDHSEGKYESYYSQSDYMSLQALFQEKAPIFKKRLLIRDARP